MKMCLHSIVVAITIIILLVVILLFLAMSLLCFSFDSFHITSTKVFKVFGPGDSWSVPIHALLSPRKQNNQPVETYQQLYQALNVADLWLQMFIKE